MNSRSINRREAILASGLTAICGPTAIASDGRPKRILLRSSWQTVNIGDIAHTPGVLRILETHLPDVEVTLWPSKVDNGVEELLLARFPKLTIAKAANELKAAFDECDFLLHGSGASLVAAARCESLAQGNAETVRCLRHHSSAEKVVVDRSDNSRSDGGNDSRAKRCAVCVFS